MCHHLDICLPRSHQQDQESPAMNVTNKKHESHLSEFSSSDNQKERKPTKMEVEGAL